MKLSASAKNVCTVSGATSGVIEDITAALKAGSDAATDTVFAIVKFSIIGDAEFNVRVNGSTNAATAVEDSVASGRYVFSTGENDIIIKQVVIEETGINWSVTFLY